MSLFYDSGWYRPNEYNDGATYQNAQFPKPRPFQETAHDALRKGAKDGHRCQMLMAPTGAGKCLGKDTPVLMADGRTKMVQDVVVGDQLLGPDGMPRNVLSVAKGRECLYRITPTKGDPYVVNESHILSLRKTPGSDGLILADGRKIKSTDDVVNVNVKTFSQSNKTARHCLKGWRAGLVDRFHRPAVSLPVPAYILGAWLGDGSMGKAALSKPDCGMVQSWLEYGRSLGLNHKMAKSPGNSCPTWFLSNGRCGKNNPALDALRKCGVMSERFIPDAYKFADSNVRRNVIAGLIDSDGHISNGGCDWISKYERLAFDFAFVCRSLGLACYVSKQRKWIRETDFSEWYWRATVSGDLSELPMLDKVAPPRKQKKRHLVHGISIDSIGMGDYYGFQIDGDSLFLLGDFTVTHNTFLGLRACAEALQKGRRAIFVCDRTTLINQTSERADEYGLAAHGVFQADHWRSNPSMPFQIASAQTLARREWPSADLIVVDEAHTQLKAWTEHIQNTNAHVIGLSATPFSRGLGNLFSNLINAATMRELTDSGILVPMRPFVCSRADMRDAETKGGEWTEKAAQDRGMEIIGDVVSEWFEHASDRQTIVFGPTIAYCEELARRFNDTTSGIAAVFTSHTTPPQRKALLEEYRNPESPLKILISVEALAKGFDVPTVSCVVDCRPLRKSLSTAIQMWGRGLRCSADTGKQDCLLLDHTGNILRFAQDYSDIFENGLDCLDSGKKLDRVIRDEKNEEKADCKCPKCGLVPFVGTCMSCGFVAQQKSLIEAIPGRMKEITLGPSKTAFTRRQIYEQACAYARAHSAPEKQAGRAAHIYKDIVGNWPTDRWRFEDTPSAAISREVHNKITSKAIAWSRRRVT